MTTSPPLTGNHGATNESVCRPTPASDAHETEPAFQAPSRLLPPPAVSIYPSSSTTTTTTVTTTPKAVHNRESGTYPSSDHGGARGGVIPREEEEEVEESPFVPLRPVARRGDAVPSFQATWPASDSLPPPYRQARDMHDSPIPSLPPVSDLRAGPYQLDTSSHRGESYSAPVNSGADPRPPNPYPTHVPAPVIVPHYPLGLAPPVAPFLVPLAPRDASNMPPPHERQDVPHYMIYKPHNGIEVRVPWDLGIALVPSTAPRKPPPPPHAAATGNAHYPPPLPPGVPSAPGMPGPPGPWLQGLTPHPLSIPSHQEVEQEMAKLAAQKKARTCDLCGKAFSSPFNCRVHIRTFHNKERKFQCELCPSKFGIKSHLTIHVQATHSGKRPYACTICPSTFARKYSLQLHVRTVHAANKESDKPKARTLKSRATQMTRQFPCRECGKVFLRKDVTLRHERGVHKVGSKKQ